MLKFFKRQYVVLILAVIAVVKFRLLQEEVYVAVSLVLLSVSYLISLAIEAKEKQAESLHDYAGEISLLRREVSDVKLSRDRENSLLIDTRDLLFKSLEEKKELAKQVADLKQSVNSVQMVNTFKRRGE